jgi:hypothetical protein
MNPLLPITIALGILLAIALYLGAQPGGTITNSTLERAMR